MQMASPSVAIQLMPSSGAASLHSWRHTRPGRACRRECFRMVFVLLRRIDGPDFAKLTVLQNFSELVSIAMLYSEAADYSHSAVSPLAATDEACEQDGVSSCFLVVVGTPPSGRLCSYRFLRTSVM